MEIRLKRFLSLLLALIMVISLMPVNLVFATEEETVADDTSSSLETITYDFKTDAPTLIGESNHTSVTNNCKCGCGHTISGHYAADGCTIVTKEYSTNLRSDDSLGLQVKTVAVNDWVAVTLDIPQSGKYTITFNGGSAAGNFSAYLFDSELTQNDIAAEMLTPEKNGTNLGKLKTSGEVSFADQVITSKGCTIVFSNANTSANTSLVLEKITLTLTEKLATAVASVNGTEYTDLQEAIVAAAPSGTVELLTDVTVDKWIMFAEELSIGNGNIITLNINGLTINGNNHTLTVKDIESAGNGNRLFFDAQNLNINDLTIEYVDAAADLGGIGLTSGAIKNVTFIGGGYGVLPGAGNVTIEGCTFKTNGTAIYYEEERDNLVVTGNTFELADNVNVVLLRGDTQFTNNTVISGRTVNVVSGSPVVSGNDFNDVRLKVYNQSTATISNNTINNLVFNDETEPAAAFTGNTLSADAQNALDAVTPAPVAQIGDTKYTSLQEALDAAAAGTGNITVEILDNVDLTGIDWKPVTVSGPGYPLITVNGNNKAITGLNEMLFASTWAGKSGLIINDLTIRGANIAHDVEDAAGNIGVGAFIGYPQASATITLNNCHLVGSTVSGGHWTGGLIGMAGGYNGNDGPVFMNLTITGCSVTDSTITGKGSAGGVIGHGSCAAWTNVVIENTTVSGNTITSTGSSTNKAGSVMGTIGAAGQEATVAGQTLKGGAFVNATVSGNNVTSGGTTITTVYGRQGTSTGTLEITGGSYDSYPIEENVAYAYPAEDFKIVENNGIYTLTAVTYVAQIGETKYETLAEALAAAGEGETVTILAGEYTTDVSVNKAITVVGETDAEGNNLVKINGTVSLTANGATVKDLDIAVSVEDEETALYINGGNILVEGCNISGYNVTRYSYVQAGGVTFKNCVLDGYDYTLHFDTLKGDLYIDGCTMDDWSAIGAGGNVYVTNTEFVMGETQYNTIRTWTNAVYENCTFDKGYSVDLAGSAETLAVNNSKYSDGTDVDIALFRANDTENYDITVNGVKMAYVAKIGNTNYATLAEAIAAAQAGETVTVLSDITLTETVKVEADDQITLDLNGKTIDGTGNVRIAIMSYGDLTVKDSSDAQTGIIKAGIGTAGNAVNICAGTFTLESGAIYSLNNAILVDEQAAVINIKGGKITAEPATRNSAVFYVSSTSNTEINISGGELVGYNGLLLWNNNVLNITGGSIDAKGSTAIQGNGNHDNTEINISGDAAISGYYTAIYHPQNGELNISGNATLTGWTGVVIKSGKVNISGGTVSGIGEAGTYKPVSSGFIDTGDGLYVEHYDNSTNSENYGTPVVSVTGGNFSSANAKAVASYVNPNNDIEALTGFVSGGTFNTAVAEEFCAEGFAVLPDINGNYVAGSKPTATVNDLGEMTIPANEYYIYDRSLSIGTVDMPLNFVMQFVADEDAEDMKTSPYADWYADFVITFEGIEGDSFNAAGCYLAGYYGSTDSWDGMWVKIPVDALLETIDEDTRYPVMISVGMPQTYDYICSGVQAFSCAMYIPEEILAANPNLKVNLELSVVDSSDDAKAYDALVSGNGIYKVSETAYTAEDFKDKVASVTDSEGNVTKYTSLADAIAAAQAGDTVTLLTDVALDAPITIDKNITIDGAGYSITQSAECDNSIALLYFDGADVLEVTVKNVTFDGLKTGAAIRTLGANITIDNCVFQNCEHTVGQGLVRLTQGSANVTNSKFLNNNCTMGISFNWDTAGMVGDKLLVENCEFSGNTANKTALVYYVKGEGCTLNNNKFIGNTVNCADNGAVVYMGFTENNVITGNLFKDNVVKEANTSTRVAGAIFFGYETEISGNAFINNTASNANGDTLGQVCTSTYYECQIDLSKNYWGGAEPVYGKDYTIQHQTGDADFAMDSYYAAYDEATNTVSELTETNYVAQVGKVPYETFEAAYAAAGEGDTIELLADVTLTSKLIVDKTITIDGNGHSIIADANTQWYTVSGKLQIKNYAPWVVLQADGIVLENVVVDSNSCAGGVKVENAEKVVFDNVSIIGTKADALTVVGSVNFKTYLKVDTTSSVIDARNGVVTADAGTVFDMTKWMASVSPATNDLKGVVDTEGNPFFCAYSTTTYYIGLTSTSYSNLTLLDDVELTKDTTLSGTLDLNGHNLTVADGKTLKVSGNLTVTGEGNITGDVVLTSASATLTAPKSLVPTTSLEGYRVVYENGTYKLAQSIYVAQIGETKYETLAEAVAAVKEGETVTILAGTVSEGTIKLPATLKNVTIKGEEGAILKDMTIMAADGNSYSYEGLTFDGITFDNSRIVFTGWRSGEAVIKDLAITNCTFQNLDDTTNSAPVHINMAATEPVENFTFTGNVIDGATGGSKSGVYAQATGEVIFTDNVINNVSFRPYVIQITTDDGIADNFTVTGNTFSGSAAGRAQGLGNNDEGTDTVNLVVSGNIFKNITESQQICYWNFNEETTTADLSKNYYDIDILNNPSRIYYNSAAADAEDLIEMGVYPYYADEAMTTLVTAPAIMVTYPVGNPVYPDGKVEYYNNILDAVPYTTNCPRLEGATIKLLSDIEGAGIRMMENDMVLDLNGHTYTIVAGTGSQGTNTSGFQIRPEVTTVATIKNGTIQVAEGAPVAWMFNVYATDFVVEDVIVDCANMAYGTYGESCYVSVSRAGDNVQFTGNTQIKNFNSDVAGDAYSIGGTMSIGDEVSAPGKYYLSVGASMTGPEGMDVVTEAGYTVVYKNGVYTTAVLVAQVGDKYYTSVLDALSAAIAAGAPEVKILCDVNEVMTSDFDLVINSDLTITADAPVKVEFYNEGTSRDFAVGSTNNNTLTIAENVHFDLTDRVIWLGYYGNNVDVVVDGYLGGYQIWHGADTTVSATGTLDSHGEAMIMRRDATLTVNGGTVTADYITAYSGHIVAKDATITAGLVWIRNNHSYGSEGTISMDLDNTVFTSNGVFEVTPGEGKVIDITLKNGTVVTAAGALTESGNVTIKGDTTSTFTAKGTSVFVAEVDGWQYTTLEAAVAAADSKTVKLLTDVTVDSMIVLRGGKNVTIEGAGKTITFNNTTYGFGVVESTLTLGEGLNIVAEGQTCPLYVQNGTAVTSANIKTVDGNGYSPIMINGSYSADITINGGKIVAGDSRVAAIYWPGEGTLTVNGGTIEGATAIYFKSGNLNITGGELIANGEKQDYEYKASDYVVTGDALVIENVGKDGYEAIGTVSITSGTFTSANASAVASYTAGNDGVDAVSGFISGGVFSTPVAEEHCAEGYIPTAFDNGTYGVKLAPKAHFETGAYASTAPAKPREHMSINIYDIVAYESLVIKVYDTNGNHIVTSTYRDYDLDDLNTYRYPVNATKLTVNIVVSGKEAGSWANEWHIAPSVDNIPATFEVWVDGIKADTWTEGFKSEEEKNDYIAFEGVYKVATVTDTEGNVTYYTTIADALAAANEGDTVMILAGTYDAFSVNKAVTVIGQTDADGNNLVNLNGKLSVTGNGVTVKNLNVNNSSERAMYISGGDILIEGCNLSGAHGLRYCYANDGDVTLKDCVITGSVYGVHFDAGNGDGDVIIDGCTITGWTSFGSAIEEVTITDTIFENGNYDQLRLYQDATLTNVTFNPEMTVDFGKNEVSADFTGCSVTDGSALTDVIYLGDIAEMGVNVTVDGEPVIVEASVTSGEDTEYYLTLTEALAAAGEGDTVKLQADVVLTESIKVTGSYTFDLNGKKLTGPDDGKSNYYAFVVDGGDLTLIDSVGTGELWAKCYGIETKSGSFTMESGKITATNNTSLGSAVVNYGGTVTINGGTLTAADNAVSTGGHFAVAETVINGGTLTGAVSYSVYNAMGSTVKSASNTYETNEGYKWVLDGEMYVLTEIHYVAQVGETKYETLAEAIEAVEENGVISLLDDCEFDFIIVRKQLTIMKNGFAINGELLTTKGLGSYEDDDKYVVVAMDVAAGDAGEKLAYIDIDNDGYVDETLMTLQAALDLAAAGETVKLKGNLTVNAVVIIPNNVTLDIESHTLTVKAMIALSGGKLLGAYGEDGGLLKVARENLVLNAEPATNANGIAVLPIWDPTVDTPCYRFALAVVNTNPKADARRGLHIDKAENTIKFSFKYQTDAYANDLIREKGGTDLGLSVIARIEWTEKDSEGNDIVEYHNFVYSNPTIQLCTDNYQYFFSIANFSLMGIDLNTLKVQASVVTDSGATAYSDVWTIANAEIIEASDETV